MMNLANINGMSIPEFVSAFGDVAEHSPWVAERAAQHRPFTTRDDMITAFETALDAADHKKQLALIRAHPDLATKAKLTDDSNREQQGAGLNTLSPEEFARFTKLNDAYKTKFGFPFIFAVKGVTKHQILASFEARIANGVEAEFAMALTQVKRIFRFRLEDRVVL
jgi:2-oxo-4-hydroxy-4-carboxy-5-ureidoimidazoline decarboxylase